MSEKQLGLVRLWSREELIEQKTERLTSEERCIKTIAGKFAEALGHIDSATYYLGQINEQYDPDQGVDYTRPSNPALDFWLQADLAEDAIKGILAKLQRVEPLVPKEIIKPHVIRGLVEAIGRHPSAESDPDVADAVNAVEDALKESQHE